MKYSNMNEQEAAHQFEERKKKILTNLIEHYAKIQQPSSNKKTNPTIRNGKKQNQLLNGLNMDQQQETVNQTQLKKIVKNALLKDIGNIDFEIQKLTKEQIITNRNKPAYLDKYHSIYKNVTHHMNQTDLSKSEGKTQILPKNQTYYTNRVQQIKFNSLVENSYSKLAESIRNHSNQKKQDEVKESQPKAYNFLQIKCQSDLVKGKTKSVNIEAIQNTGKSQSQNHVISSERKIQKPPMKQFPSTRKSESEKTTPIKSILKQSNTNITSYDINSTKANTTQHFYQTKESMSKGTNVNIQEAVNIYKSLQQLMNRSESADKRLSTNLLHTKKSNYMSQKGIRQH